MDWTKNKRLAKAYQDAFDEAYEGSYDHFLTTMEARMRSALMKQVGYCKEVFDVILDEVMDTASEHYGALQSKYGNG